MERRITIYSVILLFLSSNLFCQWELRNNGLPNWGVGIAMDACDSNTAIISVSSSNASQCIFLTTDAGISWKNLVWMNTIPALSAVDIEIIDKDHIWAAMDNGSIIATTNGGQLWQIQFYDTSKTNFMDYIEMFDIKNGVAMGDCYSPNYQPDPKSPMLVLKTSNGGVTWVQTTQQQLLGLWSGDTWRRMDFIDTEYGFYYSSGESPQKIYFTNSSGSAWTLTGFDKSGQILKFFNAFFGLVYNSKVIYRTTNGGNDWQTVNIDAQGWGNDIEFVPGNPSKVWFTDNQKLYFSADSGKTWQLESEEIGGRDIVFTDDNHGWVIGDNGKLYYTENGGTNITIINDENNSLPNAFKLWQNYPNPFNPETVISYQIPERSFVILKVYDIIGNQVAELVNEEKDAGNYSVKFSVTKNSLSSGIYFYELSSGNFKLTNKMMLIK